MWLRKIRYLENNINKNGANQELLIVTVSTYKNKTNKKVQNTGINDYTVLNEPHDKDYIYKIIGF